MSENNIAKVILVEDGKQVILTRSSQSPQSFKNSFAFFALKYLRLLAAANQQGCG